MRARDLGVRFEGTPGSANAITDVHGVAVGHTTLVSGDGPVQRGRGPVRTGVTVVVPRPRGDFRLVRAGYTSLNGTGELTGAHLIAETGHFYGPVALTNTNSVGVVRDTLARWLADNDPGFWAALPVVGETWDGLLNDIDGFHVRPDHVVAALESATVGTVGEGSVGAGTGTVSYDVKGGIGTSSRLLPPESGGTALGVLVQANHGSWAELRIDGIQVARHAEHPMLAAQAARSSIIVVVATDAVVLPHELQRLARRAGMGLARTGSIASAYSGDLFVAFSTCDVDGIPPGIGSGDPGSDAQRLEPLLAATVAATEEAIINALVAARDMALPDGRVLPALPHDLVRRVACVG